jgi:hypothetical protein
MPSMFRRVVLPRADIAARQLSLALELWRSGADRIGVITLAGAAEELLGKELEARGGVSSFRKLVGRLSASFPGPAAAPSRARAIEKVYERLALGARNNFKHRGDGKHVVYDLEWEAKLLLGRAVDNYEALCGSITDEMNTFRTSAGHG